MGIGDLRLSMTGQAGFDRDTVVDAALDDILASARQHSLKAGIFCANTDHAIEMIGRGYDFITVMTETAILSSAAGQIISTVRAG